MIKGYSYIIDSSDIEDACKKLTLKYFKNEIPDKLIAFIKYQSIVEEILYCEIIVSNDRVIFITEDEIEKNKLT